MERLYSLRRYSSSLNWYFSVCLALLFGQLFLDLFGKTSGHLFVTGILLAVAVDQVLELLPQWTQKFRKHRAFNLMKASAFMVVASPAFALVLKGGFLFTATVGCLAFAFAELLDFLKPYLGELADRRIRAQLSPSRSVETREGTPSTQENVYELGQTRCDPVREFFFNKAVLLLGSNVYGLAELLAQYKPSQLVLVDSQAERLDQLCSRIEKNFPDIDIKAQIKIPDNRLQIQHLFERIQPNIMIHAGFEATGKLMDSNPTYTTRVNVIDTIDWIDAARKNGVDEFALVFPKLSDTSTAARCLAIVRRYCLGLEGASPKHPTRLILLDEQDKFSLLRSYMEARESSRDDIEPPHNFAVFQRALHQLEWAVTDYNESEVKSLLEAMTTGVNEEQLPQAEAA